jgi:hypothetical protein
MFAADTFKLTRSGDRRYEALQSRNGKPMARQVVEASTDGNTLTIFIHSARSSKGRKQPTNVFTYKRTGGDGKPYPFVGIWKQD